MQFHYATLSAGITPFSAAAREYLAPLGLQPSSPAGAAQLAEQVQIQASMLAFQDAFWLTGLAAFLMLPGYPDTAPAREECRPGHGALR